MSYLDLISVADIAEYTGATYDSAQTLLLEQIIEATMQAIEAYCDTEFVEQLRYERVSLADGLVTPHFLPQRINGLFYGETEIIKVTTPSYSHSISFGTDSTGAQIFALQSPSSYSEITIGTKSLSTLITEINAVGGGWVATSTGVSGYISSALAGQIWQGEYSGDATNNELYLFGATEKLSISKVSKKVFNCPEMCADGILIYTSGYSVLPEDLRDALIRMIIQSYNDSAVVNTQTVKSEALGDWSATYMTDAEQSGGGSLVGSGSLSLKLSYYNVLNKYRNYSI
jgi:hypothetical protein